MAVLFGCREKSSLLPHMDWLQNHGAILSFHVFLRIHSDFRCPYTLPQAPFSLMSKRGYPEDSFAIVALPKTHTRLKEGQVIFSMSFCTALVSLAHKTRNQTKAGPFCVTRLCLGPALPGSHSCWGASKQAPHGPCHQAACMQGVFL